MADHLGRHGEGDRHARCVLTHDSPVVARRRDGKDAMDPRAKRDRGQHRVTLGVKLSDDLFEAPKTRFHLHEDDVLAGIEADVHRTTPRPRDRRFDLRAPERISAGQDPVDDACVGAIKEQWRALSVELYPEVRSEAGTGTGSCSHGDADIAALDSRDHRAVDADGFGDRRLAEPTPQSKLAELLAETVARASQFAIAVMDSLPPNCHPA